MQIKIYVNKWVQIFYLSSFIYSVFALPSLNIRQLAELSLLTIVELSIPMHNIYSRSLELWSDLLAVPLITWLISTLLGFFCVISSPDFQLFLYKNFSQLGEWWCWWRPSMSVAKGSLVITLLAEMVDWRMGIWSRHPWIFLLLATSTYISVQNMGVPQILSKSSETVTLPFCQLDSHIQITAFRQGCFKTVAFNVIEIGSRK